MQIDTSATSFFAFDLFAFAKSSTWRQQIAFFFSMKLAAYYRIYTDNMSSFE